MTNHTEKSGFSGVVDDQLQEMLTTAFRSYFSEKHNELDADSFLDMVARLKANPERFNRAVTAAMNESLEGFDRNKLAEKIRIEKLIQAHEEGGAKSLSSARQYVKITNEKLSELGDITVGVSGETQKWQEKFIASMRILVGAIDQRCQSNIRYVEKSPDGDNIRSISSIIKRTLDKEGINLDAPEGLHPKVQELFEKFKTFSLQPEHNYHFGSRMKPLPVPGSFG